MLRVPVRIRTRGQIELIPRTHADRDAAGRERVPRNLEEESEEFKRDAGCECRKWLQEKCGMWRVWRAEGDGLAGMEGSGGLRVNRADGGSCVARAGFGVSWRVEC